VTDYAYQIYDNILQATSSELNIFFITGPASAPFAAHFYLVAVALAIVFVPLYTMVLKDRKDRRKGDVETESMKHDKYIERESKMIERERQILEVIKGASTEIAGLKVALELSVSGSKSTLDRIHTRIDDVNDAQTDIKTDVAKINVKFDKALSNQTEMASKLNEILLIVDKLPNGSNFSSNGGE